MKKLTYIDLFAGAGGFSEGFYRAGFLPIAHVEMDKDACDTLKTRIAFYYLKSKGRIDKYYEYLSGEIDKETFYSLIPEKEFKSIINEQISSITIKSIFKKVDNLLGNRKVDVIIGGPPCQGYSIAGRSRDPDKMKNDKRNLLYVYFAEFLKKYKPKYFVFENVPGMRSFQNYFDLIIDKFQSAEVGYSCDHHTYDVSDYGVLQSRDRIIIIGKRGIHQFSFPELKKTKKIWNIKDLFCDLPSIDPGHNERFVEYRDEPSEYLKKFKFRDKINFVSQHVTRRHNSNDLAIYRIAINKWEEKKERLLYNELPKHLKTHKNHHIFQDRYKVVDQTGVSHTIVAHIHKDGNYYIHPDINQLRSISVREAARIQSFPDSYFFEGSRSSQFKQIGNAIPPLFSEKIAKLLINLQ